MKETGVDLAGRLVDWAESQIAAALALSRFVFLR